jgi:DNA repair protein RadD
VNLFATTTSLPPLRDYQERAVADTIAALPRNPILVAPTGAGKTRMAVEIVHRIGGRCLWLAHRMELITQAARTLEDDGAATGIIMAGVQPDLSAEVQVASVQSLVRRDKPRVDLVVIDEAHHAAAGTYQAILSAYSCPKIGLTATPFRLDGRGLGDVGFGEIVVATTTADLCTAGVLHAPKVYASKSPDLRGLRITMGDYQLSMLSDRVNTDEANADIVQTWIKRAGGKRTVCFAIDVEHSEAIVRAFREAGIAAEHIDGGTPRDIRAGVLARLRSGETHIVSNCQILTEGWDLPALECAIIARPTASLNLHLQTIGRVMRSCPGKSGAIVLDHAGNHHRHGLVTRRLSYSLDGSTRVAHQDPLGLRRCQRCGLYYDISCDACPDCGWKPAPMDRDRPVAGPGELYEFDDTTVEYRRTIWNDIESEREAAGFKPLWSVFRFEERFGIKPWDAIHSYGDPQPGQPIVCAGEMIDLVAVGREKAHPMKRFVFEKLMLVALDKGYKPGWASWRYNKVFGCWPVGFVSDVKRALGIEGDIAQRLQAKLGGGR